MLRPLVIRSLWRSGLYDLTCRICASQGLILRYHSVCADANSRPEYVSSSISVPAALFEQQVARLRRKYRCMTLEEVVDHVERRRPLPPRTVALTFDDGYLDNYEYALPALVKHRVPATIYLVSSILTSAKPLWTSLLRHAFAVTRLKKASLPDAKGTRAEYLLDQAERRDIAVRYYTNVLNILSARVREELMDELLRELRIEHPPKASTWFLSAAQIREMMGHGVSFGAHTVSHPNLPGIDRGEARREIEDSKTQLEACLGQPMRHFSYPNSGGLYPHVDDAVESYVRQAGFRSAVTSVDSGMSEAANVFRIGRLGVDRARSEPGDFSFWLERNRIFTSGDPVDTRL